MTTSPRNVINTSCRHVCQHTLKPPNVEVSGLRGFSRRSARLPGWASAADYDNQPLSRDHKLNEHERAQALLFLRGQVLETRDESGKSEKRVKNDVTGGTELVEECSVNPAPPARLRREGREYVSTGAKCHEANG